MWKAIGLISVFVVAISAYPQSKNQASPSPASYGLAPGKPTPPVKIPVKGGITPAPVATTPSGPVNPFNITFVVSARGLPNKKKDKVDVDPYIKVFTRTGTTQAGTDWTPIGQTDVYTDNDNPDFYNVFSLVWIKGTKQVLHFEVKNKNTLKDDAIGQVDIDVDEYVLQKNQDTTAKLSEVGSIVVKKTTPISFRLYARNVPKMDTFGGASDPFVECFWRKGKDGNDTLFYTTKVIEDVENADWDETIGFPNYQKGADQYWHFKVHDRDSVSGNDFVGETLVEVDPFVQKRAAKVNRLSNDKVKDAKDSKAATLTVTPA